MDLGIVKTIRWALGIDEELNQLRAQLANARTECDSKIEVLQSSLNSVGDRLVEESAILREEFKETSNNLDAKIKSADTHHTENYLTLRSQSEQTDFNLERKLNATSAEVSDLKDIVTPQRTPLLTAPFWNYTDVVAAKLKATVNHDGKFGMKAMVAAAKQGYAELVELLFKVGVSVDSTGGGNSIFDSVDGGEKALSAALESGRVEAVIKFIQLGANQDFKGNYHYHGSPYNAFCHPNIREVKALEHCESAASQIFDHAVKIIPYNENGFMCYAAKREFINLIQKLSTNDAAMREVTDHSAMRCAINSNLPGGIANIVSVAKLFDIGAKEGSIFYDIHQKDNNHICGRTNYYAELIEAKSDQERISKYEEIKSRGCTNAMGDFLYIVRELKEAYAEDMKSSAYVQADGSVADHLEDVPLLGHLFC